MLHDDVADNNDLREAGLNLPRAFAARKVAADLI
jgi:hypothetical protein